MFANVIALSEVTILRCKCLQTLSLFSTITGFTFQSEEQTMWAKQKVERQMPNRCRSTHQRTSINIMENTFQGKNLWLFVVCLSAHTTMCRFPLWVPSAFPFPLNQLIKPVSNAPHPDLGCFSQDKKIFSWLTRNVYSSVCSWWRDVKRTFRQNGCLNFQLLIRIPNFFEFHLIPPLRLFHLQVLQPPADKHHPPFLNNLEENQE